MSKKEQDKTETTTSSKKSKQNHNNKAFSSQSQSQYDLSFSSSDDDSSYPNAYRILVLGEPGVGKTSFIDALHELVTKTPYPPNLTKPYVPTEKTYSKCIPATTSEELPITTMEDDIRANRFSKSFNYFALNPHGRFKLDAVIPHNLFNSKIGANRHFMEILISEIPVNREESINHLLFEFDKIIIMAEYCDITTIRSLQYWVSKIRAPASRIIMCINKCDDGTQDDYQKEDFHLRKAKVIDHFLYQCPVEYISVKNRANIGFIYKYI